LKKSKNILYEKFPHLNVGQIGEATSASITVEEINTVCRESIGKSLLHIFLKIY